MSMPETLAGGQYLCHQCELYVTIPPPPTPTSELVCPNCHGGFLEESSTAPPPISNPNPNPNFEDLSPLFSPTDFNPFAFLSNYISNLQSRGASIQLVFESAEGGGSPVPGPVFGTDFRVPSNLGDYFVGPGLEQLIQQLAENDPNRYGTPPASRNVVEGMPDVRISREMLCSEQTEQCAVCKDCFEVGELGKEMPCKHVYHKDCILPWLELHNTCPVCRYELPTDDQDYESQRNGNGDGDSSSGSSSRTRNVGSGLGLGVVSGSEEGRGNVHSSPQAPGMVERRFRISLPWPFGGSSAESSNSGGGSGRNDGGNEDLG